MFSAKYCRVALKTVRIGVLRRDGITGERLALLQSIQFQVFQRFL